MRDYENLCYDAGCAWFRCRGRNVRFDLFNGVGATNSQSTPVTVTGTTAGAQSPLAVGDQSAVSNGQVQQTKQGDHSNTNVTSGAPIVTVGNNSKVSYTLNTSPTIPAAELAQIGNTVTQALSQLSNNTAASNAAASDSTDKVLAALNQVITADQQIAASTASGGATTTDSTVLKIVYAIAAAVAAIFILPLIFRRRTA